MPWCKVCGELDLGPALPHTCPPAWTLWSPDQGEDSPEDGRTAYGYTPEAAVEKWAEELDHGGDYAIVSGDIPEVLVRALNDEGPGTVYVVSGEAVPSYTARKVNPKQGGA